MNSLIGGRLNRKRDIDQLLAEVANIRDLLKQQYEDARNNEDIKEVLRPSVKSALEHLRSCLDYAAMDLHEQFCGGNNDRVYFPFGETEKKFDQSVDKVLPGLRKTAPRIFAMIRQIQPFAEGSNWLVDFCRRTNNVKHRSLIDQKRIDSPSNRTVVGHGAVVMEGNVGTNTFINCKFGGIPSAHAKFGSATPVSEMSRMLPGVNIQRTHDWVEFRFGEDPQDVLTLIGTVHARLAEFLPELYDQL